jgi:hypothetical protein
MLNKVTAAGLLAAVVAGATLLAAPANAGIDTDGTGGILAGNQVIIPISIPVILCGDAIAIVGHGRASCRGGPFVGSHHHGYRWES